MKDERFMESKTVHSARFGKGTILQAKGDLLKVAFEDDVLKIRTFRYPLCFTAGTLSFDEDKVQTRISKNINKEHERMERLAARRGSSRTVRKKRSVSGPSNVVYHPKTFTQSSYEEEAELNHARMLKRVPSYKSTEPMIQAFSAALDEELEASLHRGGNWFNLSDGVSTGRTGDIFNYRFYSAKTLKIPPGAMLAIQYGKHTTNGMVRSCDGHFIFFSCFHSLDGSLNSIRVKNSPTILLERLKESLESGVYEDKSSIAHQLIFGGPKQEIPFKEQHYGQESAVENALYNPITMIWGPPGTGKTETIAKICERMFNQGKRVLMLSFSNVAVDQAVLRILNKIPQASEGDILRYGPASLEEARNHPWLTSQAYASLRFPEELMLREQLEEQIRQLRRKKDKESAAKHEQCIAELNEIKQHLIAEEHQALQDAGIVAATVAKALIDPAFMDEEFDAVIFDEASMAYIPYIFYAATLAKKNFIVCGDFNQLPPVVQNRNTSNLLNLDIFQYVGIVDAIYEGKGHKWLEILDTQYRMHGILSSFVSHLMYSDLLKTPKTQNRALFKGVEHAPFERTPLALADISRMHSACGSHNGSKYNIISAFITCFLALQSRNSQNTGIISPYNQQIELIQSILEDLYGEGSEDIPLASTVHRFQGSEREVMLLDVTDAYPRRAGPLINTKDNDLSDRLINVALTRAKAKFAIVADREFLERNINGKMMLRQLINYSTWAGKSYRGNDLISQLKEINHPAISFFEEDEQVQPFLKDLQNARSSIRVWVAGPMQDSIRTLKSFGKILDKKEAEGVDLDLFARSNTYLSENLQDTFEIEGKFQNTITIIDESIVWINAPMTQTEFTAGTKTMKTDFYPIFRFEGDKTAKLITELLMAKPDVQGEVESPYGYIPFTSFADYVEQTFLCPSCGNPMALRTRGSNNFIGCSQYPACKHTIEIGVYDVETYLYEMRDCTNKLKFAYKDLKVIKEEKTGQIRIIDEVNNKEYTLENI